AFKGAIASQQLGYLVLQTGGTRTGHCHPDIFPVKNNAIGVMAHPHLIHERTIARPQFQHRVLKPTGYPDVVAIKGKATRKSYVWNCRKDYAIARPQFGEALIILIACPNISAIEKDRARPIP